MPPSFVIREQFPVDHRLQTFHSPLVSSLLSSPLTPPFRPVPPSLSLKSSYYQHLLILIPFLVPILILILVPILTLAPDPQPQFPSHHNHPPLTSIPSHHSQAPLTPTLSHPLTPPHPLPPSSPNNPSHPPSDLPSSYKSIKRNCRPRLAIQMPAAGGGRHTCKLATEQDMGWEGEREISD